MARHMDRHYCGRCGLTVRLGILFKSSGRTFFKNWPLASKRTFFNLIDPEAVKKAQEAYKKKLAERKAAEAAEAAAKAAAAGAKKDAKKGKKKWSIFYFIDLIFFSIIIF